jgi:hypothetical protein
MRSTKNRPAIDRSIAIDALDMPGIDEQTYSDLKSTIFWDITPCSPLSVKQRFRGTYHLCLPPAFTLVFAQLILSTLQMEAICSSETSVDTQRTTRHYIPEDGTLHNHYCENFKSLFWLHIHTRIPSFPSCRVLSVYTIESVFVLFYQPFYWNGLSNTVYSVPF